MSQPAFVASAGLRTAHRPRAQQSGAPTHTRIASACSSFAGKHASWSLRKAHKTPNRLAPQSSPARTLSATAAPLDDADWASTRELLRQQLGFSDADADAVLTRAFAWGSQIYWRKKRAQEVPTPEAIRPTLEFLTRELAMNAAQAADVVRAFPEVLGVSLERRVKPNVRRIETEWKLKNPRLKNSIIENPDCLGYDVDCAVQGDCVGECARCWARF